MNITTYNGFVRDFSDHLMRYACKVCGNSTNAEDAVQEAFIRLWDNRSKIDIPGVKSWLFTTVYRILIDQHRKNKRMEMWEELPDAAVEERFDSGDYSDDIKRALDALSPTQKSIVLLRDIEGYSYDDIAQIMEIKLSQVKTYLFRARKKLKSNIEAIKSEKK